MTELNKIIYLFLLFLRFFRVCLDSVAQISQELCFVLDEAFCYDSFALESGDESFQCWIHEHREKTG